MGPKTDKARVVFFGGMLEALSEIVAVLDVDAVVCQVGKANDDIRRFCSGRGLALIEIESLDDILIQKKESWMAATAISAGFGLIFKKRHLDCFSQVINIHPGCVFKNRGRHPLPTAILNGDKLMAVSIHEVTDEAIDAGRLISKIEFVIDYDSSYSHNLTRLMDGVSCLVKDLCFLMDRSMAIPSWDISDENGKYFPPVDFLQMQRIMASTSLAEWKSV